MVSSASGQDGAILPAWEYPLYPARKNFHKSHIKILYWPSLFGQGVWILALFFFGEFMDLDFLSCKKRTWPISSHLTSHLINNPYILFSLSYNLLTLNVQSLQENVKLWQSHIWGLGFKLSCKNLTLGYKQLLIINNNLENSPKKICVLIDKNQKVMFL